MQKDVKSNLENFFYSSKNFTYIYDFGDGWQHDVEIVKLLGHDSLINYPVCIGGENACPPEDCGGPPGFEDLKKILSGKDCEEKDEMLTWDRGDFFKEPLFFVWSEQKVVFLKKKNCVDVDELSLSLGLQKFTFHLCNFYRKFVMCLVEPFKNFEG